MAKDYNKNTVKRPRLWEDESETLEDIKDKLQFMLDNDECVQYIKKHYCNSQGQLAERLIIKESLEAIQDRGLIDKEED